MKTEMRQIMTLAVASALTLGAVSNCWAQINTPLIETPRVRADDYRTVLLRWNAETGAVYQVESADTLETEGPQGLQWVIRDSECAARGTNAQAGRVGKFASSCDFGLIVGHMTAARNSSSWGATHSWLPLYNSDVTTATYSWLALPQFDLGQIGRPDPLKWMALYGCNSLQQQDFTDMWTKFLLPMPPNMRLLLGSEEGVFIHPVFGSRFAANMHGWTTTNGAPMTIFEAWCDAAQAADTQTAKSLKFRFTMGTRHMTTVHRTTLMGGSWNTLNDSIWGYGNDISYDWFDVDFRKQQVYP